MKKVIGLTYDLKSDWVTQEGDPKDINAEFDAPEVVDFIIAAIEANGYTVKRIGNAKNLLKQVSTLR